MLRELRSSCVLFSLSAMLFVLGTSCLGRKHHELPGDSSWDSDLRTAVEAGNPRLVETILQEIEIGERFALSKGDVDKALLRAAQKGDLGVLAALLEGLEKYLTIDDLKGMPWNLPPSFTEIKDLIEKYIDKKGIQETTKRIEKILKDNRDASDVEAKVQAAKSAGALLMQIIGRQQGVLQEKLQRDRRDRRDVSATMRAITKLNSMTASLSTVDRRLGRQTAEKILLEMQQELNKFLTISSSQEIKKATNSTRSQEVPQASPPLPLTLAGELP